MRLYGALSELAELIIRLASGKTVKVSASEQTAAGETVVTIPNVVDGADEFVMKDTQQSLTKKTLSGSVTTDGFGNKTSDTILTNPDITANKIRIPTLINNTDRPNDRVLEGALHWSSDDKLWIGDGSGFKVVVDEASSQTLFNKTLSNPGISGGTISSAILGVNLGPVTVNNVDKIQINPGIAGTGNNHVAITNASGELVTEAQLAKSRGGIGADATNITFPASGVLVTEAGSQTLSNKTIGSVTAQSGILSVVGTGALKVPAGLGSERPASPVEGMIRYNSETDSFEGYASDTWSGLGGGGTVDRVTQASHGFVVGDVLWLNGSTYAKAKADAANTAEVVGMVSRVIDASSFEMTLSGEVSGLTGLVAGEVYFLSAATAGALTVTEPSVVGQVSLPVGVASSTTSLYVAPKRGVVVGGANLRTQLGLNGAALVSQTTNIQNVTAYTAGELSGWVYIDATTDRRFYIQVQFVKDAANAWKCAYQTTGDTPPAGFNVDVIVSGSDAFVQVQMPPVAGWVSGSVNFALNAPAVGATLPLAISPTNISGTGDIAMQSGYGINFGNETLKNYDEGTWTPRLTGVSGGVYTMGGLNVGRYTRIGNTVTIWATIQWTAVTTPYSGNLIIADLPFTNGDVRCAGSLVAPNGSSITQANAIFGTLIDPGNNFAFIIANTVGGGYNHTPTVASSGIIYGFTITYRIA